MLLMFRIDFYFGKVQFLFNFSRLIYVRFVIELFIISVKFITVSFQGNISI